MEQTKETITTKTLVFNVMADEAFDEEEGKA